jgi:anaerobic ribonucleoside-triphosphate reductase activating protein
MEDSKLIRLSGIAHESLVNGPGIRRVLYSQGCRHNCDNCFNKDTHSFAGGELKLMDEIIEDIKGNPMLRGVTFSGGDPLEQARKFAYIAKEVKSNNLSVWCYTGYTFEHILENKNEQNGWNELLRYIDVLVDGKFDENKKNPRIKYRGSSNQRVIDVQQSLKLDDIKILNYDN